MLRRHLLRREVGRSKAAALRRGHWGGELSPKWEMLKAGFLDGVFWMDFMNYGLIIWFDFWMFFFNP